jgi:hypothetical protein
MGESLPSPDLSTAARHGRNWVTQFGPSGENPKSATNRYFRIDKK